MKFRRVVLPAPKYPVIIVTGTGLNSTGIKEGISSSEDSIGLVQKVWVNEKLGLFTK